METVTLAITGMPCGHCVAAVRRALDEVPGVEVRDVRVGSAEVALDPAAAPGLLDRAIAAVQDAGYDAAPGAPAAAPLAQLGRARGA